MKVHTEYLTFKTEEQYEMVHITPQVEAMVRKSGVDDGLCFVSPVPPRNPVKPRYSAKP